MIIIRSDGKNVSDFLKTMRNRNAETNKAVTAQVQAIIDDVRQNGDEALCRYTRQFDGCDIKAFEVPKEKWAAACQSADSTFMEALAKAKENILAFHRRQLQDGFVDKKPNGVILGQRVRPLKRVGLYVPGGTAAYPSSVLMNALPAKVAGVEELVMVTPPQKDGLPNPDILAAAQLAGVDKVLLIGGAQAVAALAYGTETVPRVDKIVGPGNIFVATAKKLLFGVVDIDMIAGPSEILVMADETADSGYIAADMISQAEHDKLASAVLLTTSKTVADGVAAQLKTQTQMRNRRQIIEASLRDYGAIVLCRDEVEMVDLANEIAPEHLEVHCANAMDLLERLDNAGSIFLGKYASEPLGDYYAGPNHVLPTGGTARFFSPLGVDAFLKRIAYTYYTKEALLAAGDDIITLAEKEGLDGHANAIRVRMKP